MSTFESYLKSVGEVGNVIGSRGTIIYCSGLVGAKIWEKIVFENESVGLVWSIPSKNTEVLLLSSVNVHPGMMAARSGETLTASVSAEALGRVIDVFGKPIDGKGIFKGGVERFLEADAVPLIDRARVNQNLETGVTLIDLLVPIGKGQRELIIGDQKTGKTSFLLQVLARQAQLGTVCIYVAMGKKKSDLSFACEKLSKLGVLSKIIVIAAPSSTPSSLIYLAPYSAMAYAEYFRDAGSDVLVVMDEISRHAKYFRELSILSRRMPGRDAYPGDIFHTHSHILERAGRFLLEGSKSIKGIKGDKGKGETLTLKIAGETASITCLPVVEAVGNDITGYIQTNLMSMCDGHIFFDVDNFQQGQRPAVNVGLSVTRVGKQTQNTIEREMALKVREIMFAYSKAQGVAKFGVELLEATRTALVMGERLMAIFDQPNNMLVPRPLSLLFVELLLSGFWENSTPAVIKQHKELILGQYSTGALKKLIAELQSAIGFGLRRKFSATVAANLPQIEKICKGGK